MNLYTLCREAGLSIPEGVENCEICGIQTDSRRVGKGELFLCIRGMTADGHDHIEEAVKRGAAIVVSDAIYQGDAFGCPHFSTGNTRRAAAMLYDAWYGHPSRRLKLIAVTGTNGKTSVTYMLRAILEGAMHKCGLIGTVNCYSKGRRLNVRSEDPLANMTTPDPQELYRMLAIMAEDGVEYVLIETTSHALALQKLDALFFEAAIFTNLTPEHLDFHENMENYFSAKARLFSMCKMAILNVDDPYGKRLAESVRCSAVTCGIKETSAEFRATDVVDLGVGGSEYTLLSPNLRFAIRTVIPGAFSVINTLEAATCAAVLGIAPAVIMETLGSLSGVAGRMERVRLGAVTDFSVFIDYAHTPDALANLLTMAQGIKKEGQRVVLVFGCGGDRDRSKRSVMGSIAVKLADFCVVTSDNSRSEEPMDIIGEIISSMEDGDYVIVPKRAKAIEYVIREARSGDIILLAGKGHEEYEIDRTGRHPFCERELVRSAVCRYHEKTEKMQRKDEEA